MMNQKKLKDYSIVDLCYYLEIELIEIYYDNDTTTPKPMPRYVKFIQIYFFSINNQYLNIPTVCYVIL